MSDNQQNNQTPKSFPASTPEVAKMFGFHPEQLQTLAQTSQPPAALPASSSTSSPRFAGEAGQGEPAAKLPASTRGVFTNDESTRGGPMVEDVAHLSDHEPIHEEHLADYASATAGPKPYVKILKTILPYLAVFAVGIFLYYFFFSSVNFNAIVPSLPTQSTVTAPQQSAIQQLENQGLSGYDSWIAGYYYQANQSILDPNTDNSGNGFTNYEKYLLDLNPKTYDTLGLGMADSQAVSEGINPLTGAPLTQAQKDLIAKYIDMEAVMNRLSLNQVQHPSSVAGASTQNSFGSQSGQVPSQVRMQPSTVVVPSPTYQTQNTGAVLASQSLVDNNVDINTSVPGLLEIPDLKIKVPLMWSQDPKDFDQDLQNGVVHYPGTAMPGQIGTTYIAGHSSNYIWAKGSYNRVFAVLGDLKNNSSFQITVTTAAGQKVVYHYVVTRSQQYSPTDQAQFQNGGQSVVALSTCWPVGSTAKRLVVFGQLTQIEK